MIPFLIILASLIFIAAMFFIITLCMFKTAFGEMRSAAVAEKLFEAYLSRTPQAHFLEVINDGKKFVRSLDYEECYIESRDNLKLFAKLYTAPAPLGRTAVLCHGYKSFGEHDFSCAFNDYFSLGCNILLIDERAHGKSGGKYITLGAKEQYDVLEWCKYINKRFGDDHKIILGGMSMGCTAALLAAANDDMPGNLCAVVADCGFATIKDELTHVLISRKIPVFLFMPTVKRMCRHFAGFAVDDISTVKAVENIKAPVLFIHGEADTFVPVSCTISNYNACRAPKTLVCVPGANHGMSYLVDTERCRSALFTFINSALSVTHKNHDCRPS